MECAHHNITSQDGHLIHSSSDEPDLLFAVNGHVLRIAARLDENRVAFHGGIHCFLKRDVVAGSIQRNHESPRTESRPFISSH